MKKTELSKIISVTLLSSALAACGSSSSGGGNKNPVTTKANLSANPAFQFDDTGYVGAVEPGQANWWGFALPGTVPTVAAIDTAPKTDGNVAFNPIANYTPNVATITPAAECPVSEAAGYTITDAGDTLIDAKTFQVCELTGTISNDETLSNDVVWSLKGRVNVGNGNRELTLNDNAVVGVTLTVEAGTVFHSQAGSSLVITRGSKIEANGTADMPILMGGSDLTDNYNGRAEWGGLVLQGFAYNNKCGDPTTETLCNLAGEGDTRFFGGFDNSDSSGSLRYVIVTEAGSILSNGDELNGVGFMSVGYGTTVDYLQVHNNDDDGLEFFGGAVDAKHVVLTGNKDDDVDWDEGYVGNLQYGIIIKTENDADGRRAFELDTKGDAPQSAYQESNPTVANFTALSLLADEEVSFGEEPTADTSNNAIHMKDGSEGQFVNVLLLGDFASCIYIKDDTSLTSYEAPQEAFINVYGDCQSETNIPDTFDVTLDGYGATFNGVDAQMAATKTPAVNVTIESKEVDGSAN